MSRCTRCLIVLALLFGGGCSRAELPLEPVMGRVTLGGGEWPGGGTLTFAPVEAAAGLPQVPGWADFPSDGHFVARCAAGEGLAPGKYVVNVVCASEANHDSKTPVAVADSYRKKPHEITVERSRSGELTLDIPKR